jgi:O-antigen ligase
MSMVMERPRHFAEPQRLALQHAFIFWMGAVLYFALLDYSTETVGSGAEGSFFRNAKFFYRVLPISSILPPLFLLDYCYCGLQGFRRLFSFPALAITFYLAISIFASFQSSQILVGGWKTVEAGVCLYWAAVVSVHAERYRFPSPLGKFLLLPVVVTVYALAGGVLFPSINFIRETRSPLPILICAVPSFSHNYLSFVAVYSFVRLQAYSMVERHFWVVRGVLLLITSIVLFLTQTRAAWLAAVLALAANAAGFVYVSGAAVRLTQRQFGYLFAILVLLTAGTLYAIKSPERFTAILARGQDTAELSELSGRTVMWNIAIEEIKKRPLLGAGVSVATRSVNQTNEYKSLLLSINNKWMTVTPNLHNANLEILMNSGLVGGLPYVLLLLVWLPIKSIQALCRRDPESILIGMLGIAMVVQSMALSTLSQGSHAFLLLCLILFSRQTVSRYSMRDLEPFED